MFLSDVFETNLRPTWFGQGKINIVLKFIFIDLSDFKLYNYLTKLLLNRQS